MHATLRADRRRMGATLQSTPHAQPNCQSRIQTGSLHGLVISLPEPSTGKVRSRLDYAVWGYSNASVAAHPRAGFRSGPVNRVTVDQVSPCLYFGAQPCLSDGYFCCDSIMVIHSRIVRSRYRNIWSSKGIHLYVDKIIEYIPSM